MAVIVERTMWWTATAAAGREAARALRNYGGRRRAGCWRKARRGSRAINTFVLVANTLAADADVRVTMLPEEGAEESVTYTVGANRRFTVPVASAFVVGRQALRILVESLNPSTAGGLVVERATYWNTDEDVAPRTRSARLLPTAGAGRASRGRAAASLVPVRGHVPGLDVVVDELLEPGEELLQPALQRCRVDAVDEDGQFGASPVPAGRCRCWPPSTRRGR